MFAKVISAVLLGLTLTRFSFAAEVTSPRVRSLPNGVRVIVKSDHGLGLVAMNLVIRAGSRHEGEAESGVAHFLEHMLFRGSRSHLPGDVEASIEAMGGAASAGTL
ncbi:MAG: insulinase family protein, partial [Armatimonadetes bacterium]|nr:insulinase family protein [Armatimonadota bacterium]NIM24120.1 insulinase family protein [Armatimonadota bacterium]NIM67975.1 insulinase family protein [Armatimonadota bacterium]NIM76490.1 insulinase family protein [Armatimonadota bacterium]NIO75190.1 insulinase family protein [Armatimonadota bacterium]